MTIARLVLEIRRRAASLPRIFAGLLGIEDGANFDAKILDAPTPEVILRLDALLDDLLQFGRREEPVRALRAALIYGVK